MTIYIAFLRGINVGGKNMIKMADLKGIFETLEFVNVETYIQSGNVIFESDQNENVLKKNIEIAIKNYFGLSIAVVLRSIDELEKLIHNMPFSEDEVNEAESVNSEGESLYVSMMPKELPCEKIVYLNKYLNKNDRYEIINRDIYLLLKQSIRKSMFANKIQNPEMAATVRNWKTINKIFSLAKSRTSVK